MDFDDLIPAKGDTKAAGNESLSFDDLIPKEAPKSVPPGIMDKIKAKLAEGGSNLKKEWTNPLTALKNTGLGLAKGVSDSVDGGAQLLSRGVAAATDMVAPDSSFAQTMKGEVSRVEGMNKDREDRYQKATDGSVMAGVGRVGGNLVLPTGEAAQVERGATVLSKVGSGMRAGGSAAALQPVYGNEDGKGMPYAMEKGLQVGGGALLGGAAPVAAKGALELGSKLGIKPAEDYLVRTRAAQLFDKSKDAKADAEIIGDIGGMRNRIDRSVLARDLTKREGKYGQDALDALKAAGGTDAELTAMRQWSALTKSEQDALRGTPKGDAIAGIQQKMDRIRDLTPGEPASLKLGIVRAATDLAPLPAPLRYAMRNMLGGKETRGASAERVLDDRSQAAAALYRAENGASDGAKGMDTLRGIADRTAASNEARALAEAQVAATEAAKAEALKLKGRQISGTPGGGAYQALKEHVGVSNDDLNTILRVLKNVPEAAPEIQKIRQAGTNTTDGAIYPITDMANAVADKMGMKRGALSGPQQAPGALSGAQGGMAPVSANQQLGTAVRQNTYRRLTEKAEKLQDPDAAKAAKDVGEALQVTSDKAAREQMINALEAAHPETKDLFSAVRKFK